MKRLNTEIMTVATDRGELSERQQRLNQHLVRLVKHAEVNDKALDYLRYLAAKRD
jgi:hypothetical protein